MLAVVAFEIGGLRPWEVLTQNWFWVRTLRFFTDRPITDLEDLHGREHRKAVERLYKAVRRRVFSVVLGPRRVGKTSVIKTMLSHYRVNHILFDLSPYMGLRSVSFRSLVPASIGFDIRRSPGRHS